MTPYTNGDYDAWLVRSSGDVYYSSNVGYSYGRESPDTVSDGGAWLVFPSGYVGSGYGVYDSLRYLVKICSQTLSKILVVKIDGHGQRPQCVEREVGWWRRQRRCPQFLRAKKSPHTDYVNSSAWFVKSGGDLDFYNVYYYSYGRLYNRRALKVGM